MAEKFVTEYVAVGPGLIRVAYSNEYDEWDDQEDYFDSSLASVIEDFAKECNETSNEDDLGDLAKYFDGPGLKSLTFVKIKNIKNNYYMIWKVVYDPDSVDMEDIAEYLEGQMSDGWGEGFEQLSFNEYDEDLDMWDDELEENVSALTHEIFYYSPWQRNKYRTICLGSKLPEKKVVKNKIKEAKSNPRFERDLMAVQSGNFDILRNRRAEIETLKFKVKAAENDSKRQYLKQELEARREEYRKLSVLI